MNKITTIEGIVNLANVINNSVSTTKVYDGDKTLNEIFAKNGINPNSVNIKSVINENGKKITTYEVECPKVIEEYEIDINNFVGKEFGEKEIDAFVSLFSNCGSINMN